ncbi:transposase [Roseateles sp. DC23W]|uniref:Transposase n=1 Tax=Pelomonas dachongensis TaxID=3299029 RepID=A0ABW7EUS9_9BURK
MKIHGPIKPRERWLTRALCRRYAAVVFSTLAVPALADGSTSNRTICWAFGCLVKGESEILGAWVLPESPATMAEVFGDLHNRGVEFVRCGVGPLDGAEAEFLATFKMAAMYPSIEQPLAALLDRVRPFHRPAIVMHLRAMAGDLPDGRATVAMLRFSSEDLRQKYPGMLEQWGEAVSGFHALLSLPEPYRHLVRSVDRTAIGMQERLRKAVLHHGPFEDAAQAFDFVVDWLVRADLRHMQQAEVQELARLAQVSKSGRIAPVSGGAAGAPALV